MGCDGGTIPTRDELVRLKKKPEQKDKVSVLATKWRLCAISQDPLREPVMACELGKLYNKESVLELLIDRSKFECASSFQHLRGLKDLKQLNLTENRNYGRPKSEKGDGYIDTQVAQYICPVVGIEMNGSYKFCYLWSCGCVLSERALKEVKGDNCHKCGKTFSKDAIIILNGTEEEVDKLEKRMEEKRIREKLEKKAKKAKKQKCETASSADSEEAGPSTSKQAKMETSAKDSKLTNGDKAHKEGKNKLTNGSVPSRSVGGLENGDQKKSIQQDPKHSAAYKSLFTTSHKAKNQMKNNWVTSNPYWM